MLESRGLGRRLSKPFAAQAFDFARPLLYESRTVHVEITSACRIDAVMLWWTADMDGSSGVGRAAPHELPVTVIPDEGSLGSDVIQGLSLFRFPLFFSFFFSLTTFKASHVTVAATHLLDSHNGATPGACAPRYSDAHAKRAV